MRSTKAIWVNRENYRETKIVESPSQALVDGQVRVSIEKAALTSNNVSYAVGGDMIGYWNYYPAEDNWGQVPVWGMADIVESNVPELPEGERLWGFFPMANETVLTVGRIKPETFMEVSDHRAKLPALYNQYRRTVSEPSFMSQFEDQRCLFVPLFGTSYILYDYLKDNAVFGAEQILIGSASSKTGFGLAQLLADDVEVAANIVGVTSPGNVAFVEAIGCFDTVLPYGAESQLDPAKKTTYVDMSGNSTLTETVHSVIGENIVQSCMVGGTHWDARSEMSPLPGATPTFFFTPAQVDKRNKEWGPGVLGEKAMKASFQLAQKVSGQVEIERIQGAENVVKIWQDMLDNEVAASRGIMISVN